MLIYQKERAYVLYYYSRISRKYVEMTDARSTFIHHQSLIFSSFFLTYTVPYYCSNKEMSIEPLFFPTYVRIEILCLIYL